MQKLAKRLLPLLLAVLLLTALLVPASQAEDWRTRLRDAYGLTDDAGEAADASDERWALPITEPQRIVNYLDAFGELPDNFITKNEAKALGWDSRYNYLGDVAPGKSIGGDRFGNYEGRLPDKKGRTWYECDTGYKGKKRNATRLLYSSDGLYYYTDDHYKTFTQMFPEDGL